jgi:hypothetical protein
MATQHEGQSKYLRLADLGDSRSVDSVAGTLVLPMTKGRPIPLRSAARSYGAVVLERWQTPTTLDTYRRGLDLLRRRVIALPRDARIPDGDLVLHLRRGRSHNRSPERERRAVLATWGRALAQRSDPDGPRLARLVALIQAGAPVWRIADDPEIRRTELGIEPLEQSGRMRPRLPSLFGDEAPAVRRDSADHWDLGLAAALDELERLGKLVQQANRLLDERANLSAPEAIGLAALLDPGLAERAVRSRWPVWAIRRDAHRLMESPLGLPALHGLCRRRGWLTGGLDEATEIERAVRSVRGDRVDLDGVTQGDFSSLVSAFGDVDFGRSPEAGTADVLGRLAEEALVGAAPQPRTPAEAVLYRFPLPVFRRL